MAPRAAATSARKSRTARVPTSLVTETDSTAASTHGQAGGQAESLSNVHHQLSEQPYRGLSDEVLAQILEELHSAYQEDCIGVPPLGYLTISKRLHNIARPIWLSSLSTRDDAEYADRPIAKLMMDASLRPLVRQLELKLHGAFSQTQTAILTMLDNLRILEVYFDISWSKGSSEARILPATLLNAIASRPHLEELYFYQLVEAEDHRSEAANKRPLRVFTAPIHSIKGSLLEYLNARQVRTLNLTVLLNHNEPFTGKLPWEELSSVNFVIFALQNGQAATSDVPEALGRQLLARGGPDARILNVGLTLCSKSSFVGHVLPAFLDAFAPRRTRFTVRTVVSSPVPLAVDDDQEPWNLVEALELDAPYALTEGRNLADLAAFLDNMPAVTDVKLRQVKLASSKAPPPVSVSALPDNRLGIEYPHLAGLLAHVAQSKITWFEVSSPSEPGPVRWARERAQDPLQDRVRLIHNVERSLWAKKHRLSVRNFISRRVRSSTRDAAAMPATQRRSSGPPRANARKDEEGDQHGGEARKPYRGLSNELIRKIYDQVFAADSSIAWPGLREILVSKRIYHVARPAYLHTIEVDSCEYTTDAVIAGLLSDEHACSAVRTLKMTVFLRSEKTTAALLARLPNLRVLTLYFEHEYSSTGGSSEPLSEFFLRQLARIPRLRQLDFAEPSGIERLAIAVTDIPTILELGPWASLRHLVTVFETYEEPSSDNSRLIDFLGAQLAKYCGPTPLRALSIVMDSKIDGFVGVVRSAFSTFAPRGVTTFCFRTAGTARFDLSDSAFDYNNIRYVDIASAIPYELAKGTTYALEHAALYRRPSKSAKPSKLARQPPSRAIKREDDEGDDQPGGDVKQSYRGLSNELIRNIYDQVFAAKPEKKSSTRGLNEILVSKRIYHVARLAWLHSYKISSSACRGDKFVAGLLNDETACAAVHDLDFKVFSDHEHTTAAMLRRLPNLQYLRLSFDAKEQGRSANNPLPYPISFQTDFPVYPLKLRHVKALIQSISPRFSAFLRQTAVEHLILSVEYSQDLALGDLPWASLERLAAHFDKAAGPSFPKKVLDLLESQLRAYPDRLPLNTVIIDLSGKVVDSAAMINSTLSIFAPRGATTFRFYTAGAADLRPMGYFGGAVQDLSITSRVPYNLTADRNFASLVGFIEKMPALHRFAFYGLAVLGSDFDLDLDGVVEGELKVEYPMLFALLLCLTDTSVTTLIIAADARKTSTRYKWKRPSRYVPFRLEYT
ncbi:hypothetical protein JCM8115_001164 [Rhodotorula mucilaginosa]